MKKIPALLTVIGLVVLIFIGTVFYIKSGPGTITPSENIDSKNAEKHEDTIDVSESPAKVKMDSPPEKEYLTHVPTIKRKEKDRDASYRKEHDKEKIKQPGETAKKSEGKKDFQKISLSETENIYLSDKGMAWYVRENPDGTFFKSKVEIDEETGEITFLTEDEENVPKYEKISLGENNTLYITDKGEQWHVSENEDGETVKERVEVDENTGEMKVLETYSSGKGKGSSPQK